MQLVTTSVSKIREKLNIGVCLSASLKVIIPMAKLLISLSNCLSCVYVRVCVGWSWELRGGGLVLLSGKRPERDRSAGKKKKRDGHRELIVQVH